MSCFVFVLLRSLVKVPDNVLHAGRSVGGRSNPWVVHLTDANRSPKFWSLASLMI